MKYLKHLFFVASVSTGPAIPDEGFVVLEYRSMQHVSTSSVDYYRVQPGDTLAKIVARHYDQSTNLNKLFRQIVSENPRAFVRSDPDHLLSGSVLNMPSRRTSSWNRRDDIYFF